MSKKKLLLQICTVLIILGLFGVFNIFTGAMKPNARAEAALPRLDVSNIKLGTYKIIPNPAYGELFNGYSWSVLVFKASSGELYFWDIPTRNGAVGMPDLQWWRPFYECKNFGPTVVSGLVDETKPIICHDEEIEYEWWKSEWKWDITGKSLGKNVKDMIVTKGSLEGKYFVLQKTS